MYRGTFKDVENNEYIVEIIPVGTEGTVNEISFSTNPVIINRKSDNLFTELKPLGCTIEIMTDKILPDLYSNNLKDVAVDIYYNTYQKIKLFSGYLTPYIYNQPYVNVQDTLQLEAVSKLSVLKDIDYVPINGANNKQIVTFRDIIWHILTRGAGYDQETLRVAYHLGTDQVLSEFKISEANFFDDDDAKTPWKMDEVLTHICRYLGVSCIEYEDDWIYLIDYQQVAKSTSFSYNYFGKNIQTEIVTSKCQVCGYTVTYYDVPTSCSSCGTRGSMVKVEPEGIIDHYYSYYSDSANFVFKDDYISNDSAISYDDIYNKVEVEANAYQLEELCTDLLEDKNSHHMISYGGKSTISTYTFSEGSTVTHRIYTTSKVLNNGTGWKHRYYRMSDGSEITLTPGYEDYYGSNYNYGPLPHINTRCAVIRQVTTDKTTDPTPVKLDFENYIAFYCLDDTVAPRNPADYVYTDYHIEGDSMYRFDRGSQTNIFITKLEQPVLEYTGDIPVKYCPENGTSWITIKGDLWYQSNYHDAGNNLILKVVNKDASHYAEFPFDGICRSTAYRPKASNDWCDLFVAYYGEDRKNYKNEYFPQRSSSDADFGKGFPMVKCSLQIGDYYWDADYQGWTVIPSTFYLPFNNAPSGNVQETFACLQWQPIASNTTYEDKVGEKCYAIPIKESVDGHKVTGKIKFTLYTPSQLKPLYDNWFSKYGHTYGLNWEVLFPVIYMKNFELKYVYTDDSQWWQPSEDKDDDLVYSNTVYGGFNKEHDAVEFKINSYSDTVPISRSFVLNADNEFMTDVTNYDTGYTYNMEKHYIERLLNHYQTKKLVYETSIKYFSSYGRLDPRVKQYLEFESIDTFKRDGENKPFVIDSFELNLRENTAKVKYIEW